MNDNRISGVDSAIPPNSAVSIYQQDGMDDFPVLKAFQQYIDAEQAKARKRLVTMGVFFVILTGAVIAIFVAMLANLSQRNQTLNDRLVEFVMKERERQNAPVVVQPPPQADNSALVTALTAKLESVEQKLVESQKKAEQARAEAAAKASAEAAKQKTQTAEELEILRLKALLSAEREKAAAEKERKRQEELEAYRRKHYPELYQPAAPRKSARTQQTARRPPATDDLDDLGDDDMGLDDDGAITYFSDDVDEVAKPKPRKANDEKTAKKPAPKTTSKEKPEAPAQDYKIPVDVKKPERRWRIPAE